MGKKIKKFLKKAAKAAIIGGAIYGATKLAKNRKKKALNAITAGDIASPKNYGFDKSGSFTGEGFGGSSTVNTPPVKTPPVNKRKEWRHGNRTGTKKRGWDDSFLNPFKKGGRVTGCAKRGFGRALKRK